MLPEIAQLFKTDRKKHDYSAREWTRKYASEVGAGDSPQKHDRQDQESEVREDIGRPAEGSGGSGEPVAGEGTRTRGEDSREDRTAFLRRAGP